MKKIGLICLAIVLALGGLGIGFAHWSDSVVVEEEVTTGNVKVAIRDVGTNDDPGNLDGVPNSYNDDLDPGFDPDTGLQVEYDKDIASATSTNHTRKCTHDGTAFYATIKETITNAYPSYAPTMVVEIANCGSIPVIITEIEETHTVQCPMLFHVQIAHYHISGASIAPREGSGWVDFVGDMLGIQIDPCQVLTVEVKKHIAQEAPGPECALPGGCCDPVPCPQNCNCTWLETIHFTQWNCAEVVPFIP